MIEWFYNLPQWLQSTWFIYVTFHDFVQWGIIILIGYTAWGRRRQKTQMDDLIKHIHDELHQHIEEDASLHKDLGQSGISKGT